MGNMSYCRFQNTLGECYENIDEELSESETKARKRLIDIALDYCSDVEKEIVEED